MSAARKTLGALAILLALLGPTAAPAAADPILELSLTRTVTPLNHSDEGLAYQAIVKNVASDQPAPGSELTCEEGNWSNSPTLSYEWLRDGVKVGTERTYTLSAADEGKAIQCVVKGTNAAGGAKRASLPPLVIEPKPSTLPPIGSLEPTISGPIAAVPSGTATTQAGSTELTNVITAKGTGTLTAGSKAITGVSTESGTFLGGQVISGPGLTALGTGDIEEESSTIKNVNTSTGQFAVTQQITGTGIPPNTRVVSIESGELQITNAAQETAAGISLRADPLVVSVTSNTIELFSPASSSGNFALSAGSLPFGSGQAISGPGIQPGTTVKEADGQRLILDKPATASASGVPVSGTSTLTCGTPPGWTGNGLTWSFQWLRNSVPIAGATNPTYTVQPADVPSMLQCEATAQDAEGRKAVSFGTTATTPAATGAAFGSAPKITFANEAEGLVEVSAEFPGGLETYAIRVSGAGWKCLKTQPEPSQPATATCEREDTLPPQKAYPPLEFIVALGNDEPDTLLTKVGLSGGGAPPDSAEDEVTLGPGIEFGFQAFETEVLDEEGEEYSVAGGHPFSAGATLKFNEHTRAEASAEAGLRASVGHVRTVRTRTPRGFVGNPSAIEVKCPRISDLRDGKCPAESVVGGITLETSQNVFEDLPIHAMEPEFGAPAQFGFAISGVEATYTLTPELRAEDGYAVDLVTAPVVKTPEVFGATATLCGFGADGENATFNGCLKHTDPDANAIPLITNPTRCSGSPPTTTVLADSWEHPHQFEEASFPSPPLEKCEDVKFEPTMSLKPTSSQADSPTGMDVELQMPTDGLEDPTGIAQANLANATVTLPVGMAVNPSLASGLGACSPAEIGLGNNDPATCPQSSKVGTVEAETPLLEETLHGDVYVARQGQNPFNSLLGLYLVLESEKAGITVKVAGKVTPDPVTGQLTTRFVENPEAPISKVSLHIPSGPRAPLINPPACGSYEIVSELSPWSAADPLSPTPTEVDREASSFQVTSGPNGGPCPDGGVRASMNAGLADPTAGTTSPFTLRLSREDGSQRFRALEVDTPPGLTGYLKGIPYCPDSALASVSGAAGSGAAELAAPACPAASRLGKAIVGAGAGPTPFYAETGTVYLAGPYKGAPLSIAVVAPALAGPFDLGSVVVRNAVRIDPATARISVVSDPIPTILHGLLLDVRDIRVTLDRPNFTLAPTSCEPKSIEARVFGDGGGSATVSERFQVGGCERLGFKPDLKLRLRGGTKRGAYQRLEATLTARPGDANIARTAVTLPRSAFLAQEHIRTVCTRVRFAADQCPPGSIYGSATATSPLVDYPLTGNVYLRSSSNPLPDMVVALRGPDHQPIEVELAGRIDSKNGSIRSTFDVVPDAPVTKFTLRMRGGQKSLIINSRNLCAGKPAKATVRMTAQNGKARNFRPLVGNDCSRKGKGKGKPKNP